MLEDLKTITDEIEAHEQVERVLSLANARDVRHKFMGVKVVPALKEVYEGKKSPQERFWKKSGCGQQSKIVSAG